MPIKVGETWLMTPFVLGFRRMLCRKSFVDIKGTGGNQSVQVFELFIMATVLSVK